MKVKIATLLIGFLALISSGLRVQAQSTSYTDEGRPVPTVTSDKDDYAPGEIATITGTGWTLDSLVDVHFEEDPVHDHQHDYHDTKVDVNGNWRIEFPIEERHKGVSFTVNVIGKQTNLEAVTWFTDGTISITSNMKWSELDDPDILGSQLPSDNDVIVITNGATLTIDIPNALCARIQVGGTDNSGNSGNGILLFNEGSHVTVAGNVILGNGQRKGSLDMSNGGTLKMRGDLLANNVGFFNSGAGTIEYSGSNQTILYSTDYYNLVISSTGILNFNNTNSSGTLTVRNNFNMLSGTVSLAGLEGSTNLNIAGDFKHTGGIITESSSGVTNIIFNGTSKQNYISGGGFRNSINFLVQSGSRLSLGVSLLGSTSSGTLQSTGNFTLMSGATLEIGHPSGIWTSSTAGNVRVTGLRNYSTGASYIYNGVTAQAGGNGLPATISNLTVANPTGVTLSSAKNISNNLVIAAGTLNLGTFTHTTKTLTLGEGGVASGSWGSNASTAANKNNVYFAPNSGIVNVGTSTCITPSSPKVGSNSFTYDGTLKTAIVTSGAGETIDWYADATGEQTASAPSGTDAGTYTAYAEARNTTSGCVNDSRTLVTLTITKARLIVTPDPKSKIYGDANPAFTVSYSGFVNGEDAMDLTTPPTATSTATITSGVDSYPIVPAGGLSSNYDFVYNNGTLTVEKRSITITAEPKSKIYGDTDPDLTAQATNVVNGDVASGSLARAAGENVGSYIISKGSYTYGPNYDETFKSNDLMIGRRSITITADAKSKYCGQPDPSFTYSITSGSLVNGDSFSDSLTRYPGENAGTYAITQGTLALNNNYALSYSGATLTITSTSIDASASSIPVQIGTVITTLKATVTSAGNPINSVAIFFTVTTSDNKVVATGSGLTKALNGQATVSVNTDTLSAGVYTVTAVAGSGCDQSIAYLSVYDPIGGFVTGGGWINSPIDTPYQYMQVAGKGNFGFNAKYKKGKTGINEVDGNTTFHVNAGNLDFKSTAHEAMSLVISGSKATYRGEGTIKGSLKTYQFVVVVTDGDLHGKGIDLFRIKIWEKGLPNAIVYDNQQNALENADPDGAATILGGGSIVIHDGKNAKLASTTPPEESTGGLDMKIVEPVFEQRIKLGAYPNPFAKQSTIVFRFPTAEQMVALDVYDLKGSRIERIYEGKADANQTFKFEFNGAYLSPGIYLLRLTSSKKVENFKMIMGE